MLEGGSARRFLRFYWEFFKIGCFTLGGGWAIIAQIQRKFVEQERLLENEDLLDLTSISRSVPGLMVANASYMCGFRIGGPLCGYACVLGFVTPPLFMLFGLTFVYSQVRENVWAARAMLGLRSAVVPIVASAVLTMARSAYAHRVCWLVTAAAFCMYHFTSLSPVWTVVMGAAAGLALAPFFQKDGGKEAAPHE